MRLTFASIFCIAQSLENPRARLLFVTMNATSAPMIHLTRHLCSIQPRTLRAISLARRTMESLLGDRSSNSSKKDDDASSPISVTNLMASFIGKARSNISAKASPLERNINARLSADVTSAICLRRRRRRFHATSQVGEPVRRWLASFFRFSRDQFARVAVPATS